MAEREVTRTWDNRGLHLEVWPEDAALSRGRGTESKHSQRVIGMRGVRAGATPHKGKEKAHKMPGEEHDC